MNIQFYFDPSCPWCWITSRWLHQVSTKRDITVEWLPFSLAIKNNELNGDNETPYSGSHVASHKVLQAIEVMIDMDDSLTRFDLYSAYGKRHFVDGVKYEDIDLKDICTELNIATGNDAAREAISSYDDSLLEEHVKNATDIVGSDVGVPLIIFENDDGGKQGYFGPVLQTLPSEQEGLDLWDGLSKLATSKHFYELKRGRDSGPDVESTKRLF